MGLFLLSLGSRMVRLSTSALPAQGSVSCHALLTDDQGAVSWSMDTGVVGLTSGLRVLSALSIAGGSLARHPLSGGLSLPLFLPAVPPQEQSASAGSGEQDTSAMTTTQARRAMGARAELESSWQVLVLERENVLS